jgi:hypothetical protein
MENPGKSTEGGTGIKIGGESWLAQLRGGGSYDGGDRACFHVPRNDHCGGRNRKISLAGFLRESVIVRCGL